MQQLTPDARARLLESADILLECKRSTEHRIALRQMRDLRASFGDRTAWDWMAQIHPDVATAAVKLDRDLERQSVA
jgi:hypothetical protein